MNWEIFFVQPSKQVDFVLAFGYQQFKSYQKMRALHSSSILIESVQLKEPKPLKMQRNGNNSFGWVPIQPNKSLNSSGRVYFKLLSSSQGRSKCQMLKRVKIQSIYFGRKYITYVFVHKLCLVLGEAQWKKNEWWFYVMRSPQMRIEPNEWTLNSHRPFFGLFVFFLYCVLSVITEKG